MKIPELSSEDLDTIKDIMNLLPAVGNIGGIFMVEVRIRFDSLDTWVVIGYGESGEPCLLRFEC